MGERIGLLYFSGTDNTRIIAEDIKSKLELKSAMVDLIRIEEIVNQNRLLDLTLYDMLGIGYPIYGFGEPRVVRKLTTKLSKVSNLDVFIFVTGADFITINNNASSYLKNKLHRKGYHVFYERIICMGSNFLIGYDDEFVKQLYLISFNKVEQLCDDVLSRKSRINKKCYGLSLLIILLHWFEDQCLARLFGKSLRISHKCINCGKCIKMCPSNNIFISRKKIMFNWNCLLCMRCVYSCPRSAIYSCGFNFLILKQGYKIENIIQNTNVKGEYITKRTRGFMKHFQRYFDDTSI